MIGIGVGVGIGIHCKHQAMDDSVIRPYLSASLTHTNMHHRVEEPLVRRVELLKDVLDVEGLGE